MRGDSKGAYSGGKGIKGSIFWLEVNQGKYILLEGESREVYSDGMGVRGSFLASKAVVLKWQGGGMRRVHLPLNAFPFVCTAPA